MCRQMDILPLYLSDHATVGQPLFLVQVINLYNQVHSSMSYLLSRGLIPTKKFFVTHHRMTSKWKS